VSAGDDYRLLEAQARIADKAPTSLPGECARALRELDQLRRWKAEATEVLARWDEAWVAAGKPGPLGSMKSACLRAEVERLLDHRARLREELAKHGWGDFHYGDQGQDPAVVALLEETQ
jgi:hypothetical protein